MRKERIFEHLNKMGYDVKIGNGVSMVLLNLKDRYYRVAVPYERLDEPYIIEWIVDTMNDMIRNDIFIRKGER